MGYRGLEQLNDAVYLAHKGDERGRGAQIVFIRGFQFHEAKNPFPDNWLSEDGSDLWPKTWLSQSFPTAAIYLVDYESSISKDGKSGRLDMFLTAENLLHNLLAANIGQSSRNPVILIGQDIGGLVIKEICLQAFFGASLNRGDDMHTHKQRSFLQQVKGVFYFSTPHGGIRTGISDSMASDPHWPWNRESQGELMKNLMVDNSATSRTNEDFRKMRNQFKWRAFGLGASHQGKGHVKEASARHDVDHFCMIPASTMDICRPKDRKSTSFQLLEKFIRETVSGFTDPNRLTLPFKADPRYVPLEHTVREIRERLKDPETQVVVLYGDAGTGKSSLTMYLALQLEEESAFPDGIFYSSCGRGKEAVTILRNMLRQLYVHEDRISSNDEDEMRLLLRKKLQNLEALIILDDVWDDERESLVEKVVVPGAKNVKYLLSSQQSRGWELSGYNTCKIQRIDLITAQQIIIKHVGLRNEIPKDDADIIDEIIQMTDFHPLALATISGSVRVDSEGRARRAVWKNLKQSLLFYLTDEDPAAYVTSFGVSYPRSVFAGMMYAVNLLFEKKDESLYLMCIMALFESPFPTSLVHLVISHTQPQLSKHVFRLLDRLEERQLVQRGPQRAYKLPPKISRSPYATDLSSLSFVKMHGLRQQFILNCAEYGSNSSNSVESIIEILAPFLSATNFGGVKDFEQREEDLTRAMFITALYALYGIAEVKDAARGFCKFQLIIHVQNIYGHVPSKESLELLMALAETEERSILTPIANVSSCFVLLDSELLGLNRSRACLEVLMAGIEEHSASTDIQSAIQKVVCKYIFQFQIDDDNLSFLISEGYGSAATFLMYHLVWLSTYLKATLNSEQVFSWVPRSLAAVADLFGTETQLDTKNLTALLSLLEELIVSVKMTASSFHVHVFDLEVFVNMFQKVHDSRLDLSSILILILYRFKLRLVGVESGFLLRTKPGMQEAINTVIEKLVADLSTNRNLELLENSRGYSYEIDDLLKYIIYQVDTVVKAVDLLYDLWPGTFGEEIFVATLKSISKPLRTLVSLCPRTLSQVHCGNLLEAFFGLVGRKDQTGRSVIWSIPGATQAIVSVVNDRYWIRHQPYAGDKGLGLLFLWTLQGVGDHGIRSYLISVGFVNVLVEVIGDYTARVIPRSISSSTRGWRWLAGDLDIVMPQPAVGIIENLVTEDETAASVCASLPKLHRVLCDLLLVRSSGICTIHPGEVCRRAFPMEMCTCLQRSASTVLLYLGYKIGVSDHDHLNSSGCYILQGVTPKHSHSTVELSHAVKVQNAFKSLFHIIDNNGQRVAQVAALELLLSLLRRHSSARARIYVVPSIATRLSLLLHGDDASVRKLALWAILELGGCSQSNAADQFVGEVGLIPGVVETVVEYMGSLEYNWGRKRAVRFVARYLLLYSDLRSASRILAVPDVIPHMVLSLRKRDRGIRNLRITVMILDLLSNASGSCSFLLPVRGSVEALVALLSHITYELVEQSGPALQLVARDHVHERIPAQLSLHYTDLLHSILGQLATESEEAMSRMVATESVFDPMIVLFDKQRETEQEESFGDPNQESFKWRAMGFVFLLARRRRNAIPEGIIQLVSSALQDRLDLLTNISGVQVPGVLKSLRYLVEEFEASRPFVVKASGALESLISLSVRHEQRRTRADALHIFHALLISIRFPDIQAFTSCVLKLLPDILDPLRQYCLFEREDSVALQSSVVRFLTVLAGNLEVLELKTQVRTRIQSKLTSLILYNPQVLQNLIGLLRREQSASSSIEDSIGDEVLYLLTVAAQDTMEGMFLIVQIPGALERIVGLVFRGNPYAFHLVRNLITTGKFHARAPRYLLKCLVHVVSTNMGESIASEALHLLGQCALQNKNALHYLIDMLHKRVRCALRAEAKSYLIGHVSNNSEFPTRTLLASLKSITYDPTRHEDLEPACEFQVEVLCMLVSLVESCPQSQWRMAKYLTGICAHDLSPCLLKKVCDKPNLKTQRSMDMLISRPLATGSLGVAVRFTIGLAHATVRLFESNLQR